MNTASEYQPRGFPEDIYSASERNGHNMKAIIATGRGNAEFIDVPKPVPSERQILAKVQYAGICATDISLIQGNKSFDEMGLTEYPIRLGHEWSGIVTEVGSKVTGIKPGDHVVSETVVSCHECPDCRHGRPCPNARSIGTIGHHWPGAFADYMLVPADDTHVLNDRIDMKNAALFEPATVAMVGIRALAPDAGSTILVIGTGPIGLTGVGILKAMGVRVIVSGRRDSKLEFAKKMGADLTVNVKKTPLKAFLKEHTEKGLVDGILETSGSPDVIGECPSLMIGGKVVLLGFLGQKLEQFDLDGYVLTGNSLVAPAADFTNLSRVIRLAEQGKVDFTPLITGVYPFSQGLEAIDKVIENGDGRIKVLMKFGD